MINTAKEKLRQRILENKIEDDDDLLFFIQDASRLASLGESEPLKKLEDILKREEFAGRFDEILVERCRRGLWDLDEQLGHELGLTIIEAQDFWSFYQHGQEFISPDNYHWFESWAEKTAFISIDGETADVLEHFLKAFPIAEEDQLAVVASPVTETQYNMIDRCLPEFYPEVTVGYWVKEAPRSRRRPSVPEQTEVQARCFLACDDAKPSEQLIRHQDHLACALTEDGEDYHINRSLNENWKLIINANQPDLIERINIEEWPVIPDPNYPGFWILDLNLTHEKTRRRLLYAPLRVHLNNGNILEIRFGQCK